jgi:peroxiredoxin
MPRVEVNKKAPDIEMDDYKGQHFSLKYYQEKKWVLLVLNRGFS